MKLDKTKPFGEIIGSTDGSKFDQDGKIFDIQGNLLNSVVVEAVEVTADGTVVNDSVEVRVKQKPGPKPKEHNHGS